MVILPGIARADMLELSASKAVVVEGEEGTAVLVQFSLPDLDATVLTAYVEWTVSGVASDDEEQVFEAFAIGDAWSVEGVSAGLPEVGEEAVVDWPLGPRDYANTGGLVRFYISNLVQGWLEGEITNDGLLLKMEDLDSLDSQLSGLKLVVHYMPE
jgi:hypothetical protein